MWSSLRACTMYGFAWKAFREGIDCCAHVFWSFGAEAQHTRAGFTAAELCAQLLGGEARAFRQALEMGDLQSLRRIYGLESRGTLNPKPECQLSVSGS